jgi:hypothetical protein
MKRNHKQWQKGLGVSSGARHWIAVKWRIVKDVNQLYLPGVFVDKD